MLGEFYVYELQYPDGTPFYVGKGKGNRKNIHFMKCDTQNKFKQNIINKIRRNGEDPLSVVVEPNLSEGRAFEIEISLINYYGRRDNGTGILSNLTDGGEGTSGHKQSAEIVERVRQFNLGRKMSDETRKKLEPHWEARKGVPRTPEVCEKLRQANLGKKLSDEHSKKISTALTGIKLSKEHCDAIGKGHIGLKHSEESKEKMRASKPKKKVLQYDLDGIFVKEFESVCAAQKELSSKHISAACMGKIKTCKGYILRYKDK